MSTSGGGSVVGLMAAVPEAGSGAQPPRAVLCREGATLHLPRSGEGSHLWRDDPSSSFNVIFTANPILDCPHPVCSVCSSQLARAEVLLRM